MLYSGGLSQGGLPRPSVCVWGGAVLLWGPSLHPFSHLHPSDRWDREAGKWKEREEEEHIFISNTVGVGEVGRNLV